jgi:hypothetical protein
MSGLRLAALYGIKPFLMGFCGPQGKLDKAILSKFLKNKKVPEKKVIKILEQFEGAYPYYEFIAKKNGIKDPFNKKVVRAYWVGNKLLEKAGGIKSHHSYHVLLVGSVTGRIVLKGKLLDLCRVGWGKVEKLKVKSHAYRQAGQKLKVIYQPLIGKKKLKLGKPIRKEIDWDKDLLPKVKIGDWVSFHWNQAVEVLTKEDIKNLEKYTKLTLNFL